MSTLTVKDIGPVADLRAHLPEEGGITVLVGPNDSGKSIVLQAVSMACGGRADVTRRDGTLRGQIDLCGVTMSVRTRPRTIGDLDVETIEGRFDVSDLIDPGLKDPAAADRKRAKALLQIRGVKPDLDLFSDLLKGIPVNPKWESAADLVELADQVRAALHDLARNNERRAEVLIAEASACRQVAAGVDLEAETDADALQDELTAATSELSRLEEQGRAAKEAAERGAKARQTLEAIPGGVSSDATREAAEAAEQHAQGRVTDEADAKRQYQAAAEASREAIKDLARAKERHAEALRQETIMVDSLAAIRAAESVEPPDEAAITAAEEQAAKAREAIKQVGIIEQAKKKAAEAEEIAANARAHELNAEQYRENARAVDTLLSDAVKSDHLRAAADEKGRMRWITQHPDRGEVYYHDRSRGTRCAIAVDEAMAAMNGDGEKGSLILLRQDLWEGLDHKNRLALNTHCQALRINILTAEASRLPNETLHAVVFGTE